MSSFEVVDFIPNYQIRSKNAELFADLAKNLEKLKAGQSIRKEMEDKKAATALVAAGRVFFKNSKTDKEYFAVVRQDQESEKFYAYFGKRK